MNTNMVSDARVAPCAEPSSISVVIPTRGRPLMVRAAVRSAFAQTVRPLEVIVVVDGPEQPVTATAMALADLDEAGLRVLELRHATGGASARNRGVEAARGRWIAFLDDDDLWLPDKLARQLAAAAALQPDARDPVLACRVIARSPAWEEVWPRTPYTAGQPMGEYLFCRSGWRYGEALLQTSTLLAPRALLQRLPFTEGLPRHQDWDWLLRAAADPGVAVQCVEGEPLAIFHVEGERASVSRIRDWKFSAQWIESRRELVNRRAVRGFLATECAAQAHTAPWKERLSLLCCVLSSLPCSGQGALKDLLRAAAFLLIGQKRRRALREVARAGLRLWAPRAV